MKMFLVLALAMLLLAVTVDARDISYDFSIVGNKAVVEKSIDFGEKISGNYSFYVPGDATGISVYLDGELIGYDQKIELKNNSEIKINYVTRQYLDGSNFIYEMIAESDIELLQISVTLPEAASLKAKVVDGKSSAIFPDAKSISSDGESIVIDWVFEDIKQDQYINFLVRFERQTNYGWYLAGIFMLALIAVVSWRVFGKSKGDAKEKDDAQDKPEERIVTPEPKVIVKEVVKDEFEKHLKEEEEQVVNVLKLKEGNTDQGTLRVATGFSKATLSRILSELEQRNVIYKEKRGKKNRIFLRQI